MLVGSAAILGTSVSENTQHRKLVFLVERQYSIIKHIGRCDRRLGRVELGMSDLAIGIHKGLLIDTTNALKGTHVIRVLRAKVAWVLRFDLTASLIVVLLALHRSDLIFGEDKAFSGHLVGQGFKAIFEARQAMSKPDTTNAAW